MSNPLDTQPVPSIPPALSPVGRTLAWIHGVAAVLPLTLMAALYLLSWRAMQLIGHWPVPWKDDPKFLGGGDTFYEMLLVLINPLLLAAMIAPSIWLTLMAVLWRRYGWGRRVALTLALVAGIAVFALDPSRRMMWWMD